MGAASRCRVVALGLLLLGPAVATAGQVEDDIKVALAAIKNGDFDGARVELDKAEAHALESTTVVLGSSLASVHFYRGVLEYYVGDRNQKTLDYWRLALVADPNYAFDTSLVAAQEPQDLFEALRQEISQRDHFEAGIPEENATLRVYVDGRVLKSYDLVIAGRHLVQVLCPDQKLHNAWHTWGDAPDYAAMCVVEEPVVVLTPEAPPQPPEQPKPPREPRDINVARVGLWSGGGALLLGGAAVNFLVVNPTYAEIEAARAAPASVSRADADALTSRFDVSRFTTIGLLGAGVAAMGAGILVDDRLTLVAAPSGVGLVGQF